jgi:hypothetical protein
MRAIAFLREGL